MNQGTESSSLAWEIVSEGGRAGTGNGGRRGGWGGGRGGRGVKETLQEQLKQLHMTNALCHGQLKDMQSKLHKVATQS